MNYYNNNGLYNNPMQYGQMPTPQMPMYPNYAQMFQPQMNEAEGVGFIWVQGKEGAKAYPVAPNKTVLLLDSENPYVYKKVADKDGKPIEFKTYKLVEQFEGESSEIPMSIEYATKEDVQKLNNEIAEIKDTLLDIQTTPDPPKGTRRVN